MSSIPRGVTPTIVLTFADPALDLTTADHVYVTFRNVQGGKDITKSDEDLTVSAKQISVFLSQSDTLSFTKGAVAIQANWTYASGARAASTIVNYTFGDQLLNRVVE